MKCEDSPALICRQCLNDVNAADQLRRKIIRADKYFQVILNKSLDARLDATELDMNQEPKIDVPTYKIEERCVRVNFNDDIWSSKRTDKKHGKKKM